MRSFACGHCGHLVFFENFVCLHCDTPLGIVSDRLTLVALEHQDASLQRCANARLADCNWTVAGVDTLCRSCELTRTRPVDDDIDGMREFARAEAAKRRAVFQLLELRLPGVDAEHLRFDLLTSSNQPVTTGHADGVITIDPAEADDAQRELRRQELAEPYRTVLGHLRHELGHYFQPRLIDDEHQSKRCRDLFGDERADYQQSLEFHYAHGAPKDWQQRWVSAYATMHPSEDWAETFAHYLHIRDTLQTAAEFGVTIDGPRAVTGDRTLKADPRGDADLGSFIEVLQRWLPLTYALNAVNRSLGRDDLYPFAQPVIDKLSFIHRAVVAAGAVR